MKKNNFQKNLDKIKSFFPSPVSDPVMDGYFISTIQQFLDKVDNLKSDKPVLGKEQKIKYRKLEFSKEMKSVESVTKELVEYCKGLPIWAHPNAQLNVIPPSTIPSITAFIASSIYNPNIIWDEYSANFARAEVEVVSAVSELIGFNEKKSGGILTFGGTGTNLYGAKIGLEKLGNGKFMKNGLRQDVKIVVSQASHYSWLNIASWLGIGTKNLIKVKTSDDDSIDLEEFEKTLDKLFRSNKKVALVSATLGTTDAFGIDDISKMRKIIDKLSKKHSIKPPHLHADAVIGWVWNVFSNYPKTNPLGFKKRTLDAIDQAYSKIKGIKYADSLGVDFHKTGYAPYLSSLFIVKNRKDFNLITRDLKLMPYLYQFGNYHPGVFTLECSRYAAGALGALANIRLLGIRGYQTIIGHNVQVAENFREELEKLEYVHVLNDKNRGPVTLFRVYKEDGCCNQYEDEIKGKSSAALKRNNKYNRLIFDKMHSDALKGKGIALSFTTGYKKSKNGIGISAIKSFIMSPWTKESSVDTLIRQIKKARKN